MLTGRLQMSLPVGGLQANDISIPISIYNHGGSLQVAEGDGDCGLGWGLSASGSVTRRVMGLPDEYSNKGWLSCSGQATAVINFSPTADDNLTNCDTNEQTDYNAIKALAGNEFYPTKDTEPDFFSVSAPGLSLQFVLGADGQPKLLTYQDVKIEYPALFNSFTITTSQGMIYLFSSVESVDRTGVTDTTAGFLQLNTGTRYYKNQITFPVRWHLTKITSQATGTEATFNYQSLPEGRSQSFVSSDSLSILRDVFHPLRISSINLKSYKAEFTWGNDLLNKVVFTESDTQDRSEFTLEYRSLNGTFGMPYKAILYKARQVNNCSAFSAIEFEYKDITPGTMVGPNWTFNSKQDYFGYHNGVAGNVNNPTLYFYPNESNGKRLRVTPIPGGSPTTIAGNDRGVRTASNGFGALTRIKHPTGGFTAIEYESNNYIDASTGEELSGGGVRVRQITRQGGEIAFGKTIEDQSAHRAIITTYEYKLSNSSSSGVLLSPLKLGYITTYGVQKATSSIGDAPSILYTRISEIIPGQGKRLYEFSIPGVFPDTVSGSWTATKSRIARLTANCVPVGNVKNGYYLFPYAPSANNTKRGLLTKVSEFNNLGTLVRDRTETFTELTSNPTTIKGLRFERINGVYHYGHYSILTGRVEVPSQTIVRESSELVTNYMQSVNAVSATAILKPGQT